MAPLVATAAARSRQQSPETICRVCGVDSCAIELGPDLWQQAQRCYDACVEQVTRDGAPQR